MATSRTEEQCSVKDCPSTSYWNPLMTFFRLPARPERRREWLKLMDREDLISNKNWVQHRVCEIHFRPHNFQSEHGHLEKKLTRFALPTLFMPVEVFMETSTDHLADTSTSNIESKAIKTCDNSTQTVKYEDDDINAKALRFKVLCDKFLSKEVSEKVKARMIDPIVDYQPILKKVKKEEVEGTFGHLQDDFVKTETFFT